MPKHMMDVAVFLSYSLFTTLIEDQVKSLCSKGVAAVFINKHFDASYAVKRSSKKLYLDNFLYF